MGTALGGYCSRDTPARSLPADEHHLHRKATTFGSNSCGSCFATAGSATLSTSHAGFEHLENLQLRYVLHIDGCSHAGSYAGAAAFAHHLVHERLAVHELDGLKRADIHAHLAAGAERLAHFRDDRAMLQFGLREQRDDLRCRRTRLADRFRNVLRRLRRAREENTARHAFHGTEL